MSNFKRYFQNNNIVFVTIVTYNRQSILIKNIEILRQSLINPKYDYKIIAGVILPEHMHLLIQNSNANEFSKIIASIKTSFSKQFPLNIAQTDKQLQRREKGIWQRKFYDHIIRNEKDFNRHLDYIHYNPMKHYQINPKDWKYSSFKKFVAQGLYEQDWCNLGDKNNIRNMDLE